MRAVITAFGAAAALAAWSAHLAVAGELLVRLAASDETSPELRGPIGDLWSSAAMTDENLQANRSSGWLLPANLSEARLLGWKGLKGNRTNLVVKRMSTVRILGGWSPKDTSGMEPGWPDVVWRIGGPNGTGAIQYRWPALFDRLDPMVDAGISPTFVLDNVPFALAGRAATLGVYGQTKGPRNTMADYHATVKAIVQQLCARYGTSTVRDTFRFRVATEPNTSPGHWSDTVEEWYSMYDAAADAVTSALPGATIGPGNFCPFALTTGCKGTLDTVVAPIIDHIAAGRSTWTNVTGRTPIAWLASSFYGSSGPRQAPHIGYDPSRAGVEAAGLVSLAARHPERLGSLPLYFHEFGMLGSPTPGDIASEPGAFGGAWRLAASAAAASVGVSHIYRWGGHEVLRGAEDVVLLHSNLFLSALANAAEASGGQSRTLVLESAPSAPLCAANGTVRGCRSDGATLTDCCVLPVAAKAARTASPGTRAPASVEPGPDDLVASGFVTTIQPPSEVDAVCDAGAFKGPGVQPLCRGDTLLLLGVFATGHSASATANVSVALPRRSWWNGTVPTVAATYELNAQTSVFDSILAEAKAHDGWLAIDDGAIRRLDRLLTAKGMQGIEASASKWRTMQEALLSPVERQVNIAAGAGGITVTVPRMAAHSVVAVVLRG